MIGYLRESVFVSLAFQSQSKACHNPSRCDSCSSLTTPTTIHSARSNLVIIYFMVPELCPLIIWGKRASLWSPCFNLSFPLSNILSLYTNVRVQEIAMGLVVLVKKMSSSLIFYCKIPILCQSLVKKTDKFRELWNVLEMRRVH